MVHTVSSADPLADLPPGAARALQAAILVPGDEGGPVDVGSVLERCDAVRELVERWQDAFFTSLPDEVDLEEEARWAAEAGMSLDEVESGYSERDDPVELLDPLEDDEEDLEELADLLDLETEPDEDDPRRLLPEELVAVLERELLLLPLRVRLEALVAAVDLIETWSDLVADREKLLGHLVISHAESQVPHEHEALVERHAALHAEVGPAHQPPAEP